MRICLVPCMASVLPVHDPADGHIEQSHRLPDLGQAVAVVHAGTTDDVIAVRVVGSESGRKQLAERQSRGKPLLPGNFPKSTLVL